MVGQENEADGAADGWQTVLPGGKASGELWHVDVACWVAWRTEIKNVPSSQTTQSKPLSCCSSKHCQMIWPSTRHTKESVRGVYCVTQRVWVSNFAFFRHLYAWVWRARGPCPIAVVLALSAKSRCVELRDLLYMKSVHSSQSHSFLSHHQGAACLWVESTQSTHLMSAAWSGPSASVTIIRVTTPPTIAHSTLFLVLFFKFVHLQPQLGRQILVATRSTQHLLPPRIRHQTRMLSSRLRWRPRLQRQIRLPTMLWLAHLLMKRTLSNKWQRLWQSRKGLNGSGYNKKRPHKQHCWHIFNSNNSNISNRSTSSRGSPIPHGKVELVCPALPSCHTVRHPGACLLQSHRLQQALLQYQWLLQLVRLLK